MYFIEENENCRDTLGVTAVSDNLLRLSETASVYY